MINNDDDLTVKPSSSAYLLSNPNTFLIFGLSLNCHKIDPTANKNKIHGSACFDSEMNLLIPHGDTPV